MVSSRVHAGWTLPRYHGAASIARSAFTAKPPRAKGHGTENDFVVLPDPDGRLQLEARVPEALPLTDQILLLRWAEGVVASVEQQTLLPAKVPPVTGLRLPEAVRTRVDNALAEGKPLMLAHVDEDGRPVLSFRGSVQTFGDDTLAMWVRNPEGGLVRGLARNPAVALMYRDQQAKATYQFHGRARVVSDGATRDRIYEHAHKVERDHDFGRLGAAVLIELDRVEGYGGLTAAGPVDRVNMRRDAG